MVELFKLLMANPLEAVVAALCMLVASIQLGMFSIQEAQAVAEAHQESNNRVHEQVVKMNDSLIRIDENVKIMKEQLLKPAI